jgi:hypothetical protein
LLSSLQGLWSACLVQLTCHGSDHSRH